MNITIGDINILFMLQDLNISAEFFTLNFEFYITDLLINDIRKSNYRYSIDSFEKDKKIHIKKLSIDELQEVISLGRCGKSCCIVETSAIWLAMKLNAIVLSYSKTIAKGQEKELVCQKTEWILTELLNQNIIKREKFEQLTNQLKTIRKKQL